MEKGKPLYNKRIPLHPDPSHISLLCVDTLRPELPMDGPWERRLRLVYAGTAWRSYTSCRGCFVIWSTGFVKRTSCGSLAHVNHEEIALVVFGPGLGGNDLPLLFMLMLSTQNQSSPVFVGILALDCGTWGTVLFLLHSARGALEVAFCFRTELVWWRLGASSIKLNSFQLNWLCQGRPDNKCLGEGQEEVNGKAWRPWGVCLRP